MNKPLKSNLAHVVVAALFAIMPIQQTYAAPGTLPSTPLFLSIIVSPNVFFTLDDSSSMRWETMVDPECDTCPVGENSMGIDVYEASPLVNNQYRDYYTPSFVFSHNSVVPPVSLYPEAWILKSSLGNKNYYDPNVAYRPWSGLDASGNPLYENADPTHALFEPYSPLGGWVDLTVAQVYDDGGTPTKIYLPTYYTWAPFDLATDLDNDGLIHATLDTGTEVTITDPAELINFANWFQYYRKREFALKAAMGQVIHNESSNRMGLYALNAGHLVDADTMSDATNKLNLLNTFYNVRSSGTSPLRTALENVGEMFIVGNGSSVASPILDAAEGGECQQNFNILMSDAYWNGPLPTWGTKPPKDGNNTDEDTGTNSVFDGDADQSNDGGNYGDIYESTLADVAMHYYENDLASSLPDNVPIRIGIDQNRQQHLVNYMLSFGLTGSPGHDPLVDDPAEYNSGFVWNDPTASAQNKIDDMWHAAYNSRGLYLYAQNANELEAALNRSMSDIYERTGNAAAVAVNSARLSTESVVYLAQFNTAGWQGNLFAYPIIDLDTGELASTPKWDTASQLNSRDLATDPRVIISFDDSLGSGVPFQWLDLSNAMKGDLKTNPSGGSDSVPVGKARLDYLRGDRSREGTDFRVRTSLLGDMVNSGPVFVGEPNLAWPDLAPFPTGVEAYSEFKDSSVASRQKMVYVGANDGMLHGFNDDTGKEEIAYIPGLAYSQTVNKGLHYLTDPNYLHNYYVDLTPTVSDIFVKGTIGGSWKTILIGGMRGGGRGYFALDITDPSSFSESNAANLVGWEFTSDDDADLGYSYSRVSIAMTNAGTWVAIFGNGYNSTGSGQAALFIVDITKGVDGTWDAGDYVKILTGAGSLANLNGLASPALADVDGNGTVDRVYAGDLQGNMWVFDLSGASEASWVTANLPPTLLFTTPATQPITAKPVLASHPTQPDEKGKNSPNLMVYFGTGQYLVNGDKTSTDVQSFYGVWDMGDSALVSADLIEQTFSGNFTQRVLSRNAVDYSIDHGWYFDLTDSGERAVTSPIARADTVFFNSFVPVDDPCASGGYGYKFAVDMATGGSPLTPVFDFNDDGVIDASDTLTGADGTDGILAAVRQEGFLPEPVFIEDLAYTGATATKIKSLSQVPSGRFSWQELIF